MTCINSFLAHTSYLTIASSGFFGGGAYGSLPDAAIWWCLRIDVGTLLAFLFFFFRWRPMFSSYFVCVFFGIGPSASMRVRIWTHRYFFTCNNFT